MASRTKFSNIFHRFKKNDKENSIEKDVESTEEGLSLGENAEMVSMTNETSSNVQVLGSKDDVGSMSSNHETVYEKHVHSRVVVKDGVGGDTDESEDVIFMDEISSKATKVVVNESKSREILETLDFERTSSINLKDAHVFKDVHVDAVTSQLESSSDANDGEITVDSSTSKVESFVEATSGKYGETFESFKDEITSFKRVNSVSKLGEPVFHNKSESKAEAASNSAVKNEHFEENSRAIDSLGKKDTSMRKKLAHWWRSGTERLRGWFVFGQDKGPGKNSPVKSSDFEETSHSSTPIPGQSKASSSEQTNSTTLAKMEKRCCCEKKPTFYLNKMRFYPAFAIANFLVVITQFIFNGLYWAGPDGTIFKNSTEDRINEYSTSTTPDDWTFGTRGFIYAWQAAWVIFTVLNICLKGSNGQPAYKDPPYIPNTVFIVRMLIAVLNVSSLIAFDRGEIEASLAILIAYTLLQYLLLAISIRALDRASHKLVEQGRTTDIWLHRGLLQNGVGMQMAWVNLVTLGNLQMVLIHSGDKVLCEDNAGILALSILAVLLVVLPIIDMVFLDRFARYLITPYIVVVVALAGSISKNWDSGKDNSNFSAVLITYSSSLLAFKIGLTIYRHMRQPRYTTECVACKSDSESVE